ncbi:MAG: dTDP-4-dehydrorhamnose reductase [SAR324 cluster bacterium]|nr:dTDP-4-dehydrorhamnose reductase [SAR324 cluster bacterium]
MKVLVTGADGQLGREIRDLALSEEMTFTDVAQLDLTNFSAVSSLFEEKGFDLVINCAAYTAVDRAETNEELATKVNNEAVANLARLCLEHDTRLIHISTDYVFDGNQPTPYKEEDATNPQSVYGKTKLAGENAILETGCEAMILRTAWLYSSFGANIAKTILKFADSKQEISFVYDQIGTPTYAADLAQVIGLLVQNPQKFRSGIYHYTNEGVASWYDFAAAIVSLSKSGCHVHPIETFEYPVPAPRPTNSLLNKRKIKDALSITIPHWRDSLAKCLEKLNS